MIEKEKNEQKRHYERPFLQVPTPYCEEIIVKNEENNPKKDINEDDDGVIIIDL
mgnify:FL=1